MSVPELIAFFNPQGNFDPEDSYWTEHPDFGGQLVYVKEIAIALGEEFSLDVDIITRQIKDPDWPEFSGRLDSYPVSDRVRIIRLPFGGSRFLAKEQLWPQLNEYVEGIEEFYREEGRSPDFVTTHYADGGLAGALYREKTGTPFSFTGHSLGAQKMDKLNVNPDNLDARLTRYKFHCRLAAERVSMANSSTIFVSTTQERDEQYTHRAYRQAIQEDFKTKFALAPPGVNTDIFNPEGGPADDKIQDKIEEMFARDLTAERQELPAIIAASRLDKKKNHTGLVKAFACSRKLQEKANLAITLRGIKNPFEDYSQAGPEEREILDQIMDVIREHNLKGKVSLFSLASQQELASCYRILAERRSVFALTAFYEPFGLAPIEAMASGLPVAATCSGGPAEILRDQGEKYGVLIDPEDPEDIARGLLEIFSREETWEKYHRAGLQRVRTGYTWETTADRYQERITDILENPAKFAPTAPRGIPEFFITGRKEEELRKRLEELYLKD